MKMRTSALLLLLPSLLVAMSACTKNAPSSAPPLEGEQAVSPPPSIANHTFTHFHPCVCESVKEGKDQGVMELRRLNPVDGKLIAVLKRFGKPKNAQDIEPAQNCRYDMIERPYCNK